MKRTHALEWEDLSWFPSSWRDYGTDFLKFIATKFDIYKPIVPIMRKALEKSEQHQWVDLASGGGSGLTNLAKALKADTANLKITLTDLYPNIKAFKSLQEEIPNTFVFEKSSINATKTPKHLDGSLKTIFGAFHHFRPENAKQILQNAVDSNSVIAVFEPVGRNFGSWFAMLFAPLNVFVFTLFIRPVRLSVLPFIYLIPLIPLFVLWYGIASIFRTYSLKELKGLVASVENTDHYHWEIDKTAGAMPIYYLLSYKRKTNELDK